MQRLARSSANAAQPVVGKEHSGPQLLAGLNLVMLHEADSTNGIWHQPTSAIANRQPRPVT